MGNDSKFKGYLIILLLLVALSAGMFVVQNFVIKTEEATYVNVYKSNQDIAAYERIDASMFQTIQVPEDAVAPGLLTEKEVGQYFGNSYAKSIIYQGEYLTSSLVTRTDEEKGLAYSMQIQPTYVADVAYNDLVDIYTIAPDGSVEELFTNKRLYKSKTEQSVSTGQYQEAVKLYIRVTRQEMFQYYSLLRTHLFIVLPQLSGEAKMNAGTLFGK